MRLLPLATRGRVPLRGGGTMSGEKFGALNGGNGKGTHREEAFFIVRKMTPLQRRLFILVDEWLGIALCLYLWKTHDVLFPYVLTMFLVAVYGISYPLHWWAERKGR